MALFTAEPKQIKKSISYGGFEKEIVYDGKGINATLLLQL